MTGLMYKLLINDPLLEECDKVCKCISSIQSKSAKAIYDYLPANGTLEEVIGRLLLHFTMWDKKQNYIEVKQELKKSKFKKLVEDLTNQLKNEQAKADKIEEYLSHLILSLSVIRSGTKIGIGDGMILSFSLSKVNRSACKGRTIPSIFI